MDEISLYASTLRQNLRFITDNTCNITEVLTSLFAKQIITLQDRQHIKSQGTDEDMCITMYSLLMKILTNKAFYDVIDILRDTGNTHVANILVKSIDSKIRPKKSHILSYNYTDIIRRNMGILIVNTASITSLTKLLVSKNSISITAREMVLKSRTDDDTCWKLYTFLMKRMTDKVFDNLIQALLITGNTVISDLLSNEYLQTEELRAAQCKILDTNKFPKSQQFANADSTDKSNANWYARKWWPTEYTIKNSITPIKLLDQVIVTKLKELIDNDRANKIVLVQKSRGINCLSIFRKTSIARLFAVQYKDQYNHIITIDCEEGNCENSIQEIATLIDFEKGNIQMETLKTIEDIYEVFISTKCLFIFDNAGKYSEFQQWLLSTKIPLHHFLFTTEHEISECDRASEEIQVLELDTYTAEEAEVYLSGVKETYEIGGHGFFMRKELAEEMEYVKVALESAVNSGKSIIRYLKEAKSALWNAEGISCGSNNDEEMTVTGKELIEVEARPTTGKDAHNEATMTNEEMKPTEHNESGLEVLPSITNNDEEMTVTGKELIEVEARPTTGKDAHNEATMTNEEMKPTEHNESGLEVLPSITLKLSNKSMHLETLSLNNITPLLTQLHLRNVQFTDVQTIDLSEHLERLKYLQSLEIHADAKSTNVIINLRNPGAKESTKKLQNISLSMITITKCERKVGVNDDHSYPNVTNVSFVNCKFEDNEVFDTKLHMPNLKSYRFIRNDNSTTNWDEISLIYKNNRNWSILNILDMDLNILGIASKGFYVYVDTQESELKLEGMEVNSSLGLNGLQEMFQNIECLPRHVELSGLIVNGNLFSGLTNKEAYLCLMELVLNGISSSSEITMDMIRSLTQLQSLVLHSDTIMYFDLNCLPSPIISMTLSGLKINRTEIKTFHSLRIAWFSECDISSLLNELNGNNFPSLQTITISQCIFPVNSHSVEKLLKSFKYLQKLLLLGKYFELNTSSLIAKCESISFFLLDDGTWRINCIDKVHALEIVLKFSAFHKQFDLHRALSD